MGRGFDNIHLIFTLENTNVAQEMRPANKKYVVCIENYLKTIHNNDMSNNNCENSNQTIDECDSEHVISWSTGCATILLFHK